jgi:hypothetical protein
MCRPAKRALTFVVLVAIMVALASLLTRTALSKYSLITDCPPGPMSALADEGVMEVAGTHKPRLGPGHP